MMCLCHVIWNILILKCRFLDSPNCIIFNTIQYNTTLLIQEVGGLGQTRNNHKNNKPIKDKKVELKPMQMASRMKLLCTDNANNGICLCCTATMGAIFGLATCLSAQAREAPDDPLNYFIGGCASGIFLGARSKCHFGQLKHKELYMNFLNSSHSACDTWY